MNAWPHAGGPRESCCARVKWRRSTTSRASFSIFDRFPVAPKAFEIVVGPRFFRKDIDHAIAVVHQNPLGVGITLHARRNVALLLQLLLDLVGDGLVLAGISAAANDQGVSEGGHV